MSSKNPETKFRTQLMLRVADGKHELATLVLWMTDLDRFDDILRWCLKNNMTGKNLLGFWTVQHKGSMLETSKALLGFVEREEKAQIIIGKDWRAR